MIISWPVDAHLLKRERKGRERERDERGRGRSRLANERGFLAVLLLYLQHAAADRQRGLTGLLTRAIMELSSLNKSTIDNY